MTFTCIITGCSLVLPAERRWLHGDLFDGGLVWVFNGVMSAGEGAWSHDYPSRGKALIVTGEYWERRGVLVAEKLGSEFNNTAREYLRGAL
jgi:hypothetical protein